MTVRRHRDRERGAAAVEFALVVPILVMLLLGIVDYGLYFSDSLALRAGVREGARKGVVKDFPSTGSCSTGNNVERTACLTEDEIDAIGGDVAVRVQVLPSWREDNDLLVCALVTEDGLTGFTPMPGDGIVTSKIRMRIEQGPTVEPGTTATVNGTSSTDWSWCV